MPTCAVTYRTRGVCLYMLEYFYCPRAYRVPPGLVLRTRVLIICCVNDLAFQPTNDFRAMLSLAIEVQYVGGIQWLRTLQFVLGLRKAKELCFSTRFPAV